MTIRTKMTILFLSIVTILLLVFCILIYFLSEKYRQTEYKTRLRQESLTAATVFFNKEEISPDLLKLLARNQMTALNKEEIIIFNANDSIIYQSSLENSEIDKSILAEIKNTKEFFWQHNEVEQFGMVFNNKSNQYIVITSAIDKYGLSKQRILALLLSSGGILLLLFSSIIGWFFAGGLLRPMQQMIRKIDTINASQLNLRLSPKNKSDELGQLTIRFNQMLDRLQEAFNSQRSFVSHASHELRTPLTSITGQIQVSLLANDNVDELRIMAKSVLEDVNLLNKLTNNLLYLATIDSDESNIKMSLINILDLLLQGRIEILKKNKTYEILIDIIAKEDILPEIYANETLMYTAFLNLLENGTKYSPDHTLVIELILLQNLITIKFKNKTNMLSMNELDVIFNPFTRGSNSKNIKGHGIGLSLTKRIIKLHKGDLNASLITNEEIEFTINLPKN